MKVKAWNLNEQLKLIIPRSGTWHRLPPGCMWWDFALREKLIDDTGKRIDYDRTINPFPPRGDE